MGSRARRPGLALVVLLSLLLVGCGASTEDDDPGVDTASTDGEESPSEEETTATEVEAEPTESEGGDEGDAAALDGCEATNLQYASFVGGDGPQEQTLAWWGEELESRTEGLVTVEYFYGGSLLPAQEILPGVRDGRAQLGLIGPAQFPSELPISLVAGIPLVTRNAESQIRAMRDLYERSELLQEEWSAAGVRPVIWWPQSVNTLGTREPVSSLEDIRGLQVRTLGYINEAIAAVGANPIALPAPEMYESLQRGVIDAFSAVPFEFVTLLNLHEVAPNITDTGIGNYNAITISMNQATWDSLCPAVQAIIDDLSAEYLDRVVPALTDWETEVCDILIEAGASVTALPDSEVEAWKEAVGTTIYDQWVTDTGLGEDEAQAVYEEYLETLERFDAEADYVPGIERCANR